MSEIGDKIRRGLWGYIIGDCVGTPTLDRNQKGNHYSQEKGELRAVLSGVWSTPTLYALRSMTDVILYENAGVESAKSLRSWLTNCRTHSLVESYDSLSNYLDNRWYYAINGDSVKAMYGQRITDEKRQKDALFNEIAVLNVLPLALLAMTYKIGYSDLVDLSDTMNPNQISQNCYMAYAAFVQQIVANDDGKKLKDIAKYIIDHCNSDFYYNDLMYFKWYDYGKIMSMTRDDISNNGLVSDTFKGTLYCLLNTDSYDECVREATFLGNDTSSIAALAGGLAGLYYGIGGENGIPRDWIPQVKDYDMINGIIEKFVSVVESMSNEK